MQTSRRDDSCVASFSDNWIWYEMHTTWACSMEWKKKKCFREAEWVWHM